MSGTGPNLRGYLRVRPRFPRVDLLIATGADALVAGDGDLLAIAARSDLPILTPVQLRETLSGE